MKKLLLTGAIALFGLSNAQITKGSIYVSGQVNYSHTKSPERELYEGDRKGTEIKISPSVGFFIAPNLTIGTSVGFINNKYTSTTVFDSPYYGGYSALEISTKNNVFEIAPFVRKYWTLSDKLYFFGHLEIPLQFGKIKNEGYSTSIDPMTGLVVAEPSSYETNANSFGVKVKPGLDYFLSKNWTIEATLGEFGYQKSKQKDMEEAVEKSNFGFNLSSVAFGVKYVFAK